MKKRKDLVLVDTSAWIEFFNRPGGRYRKEVSELLEDDLVVISGQVLAEVLQGARPEEFNELQSSLEGTRYLEIDRRVWEKAGAMSNRSLREGKEVPLSDFIIAATAIEFGLRLLEKDRDYDNTVGLDHYNFR